MQCKDTPPRGDSLVAKVVGVKRKTQNLGMRGWSCQRKFRKKSKLRRSAPRGTAPVTGSRGLKRGMCEIGKIEPETIRQQEMERETGFEPATLGLEGRCSSR